MHQQVEIASAANDPLILAFDEGALTREAEAFRRHPGFGEALKRYTDTALETFDGHWRQSKMVCQTARYVTLFLILYLHSTADPDDAAGGASTSRLKQLVALGPFASASWVKLAVRTFERTGMIEYLPAGRDRRVRRFRPTEELIEMGRRALTAMLEALGHVCPLPLPPAEFARRPGVVESFARVTVEVYLAHRFILLAPFPEIAAILSRDFGHLVFTHLIRTMQDTEGGEIVAEAPSGELAKRFGMSRAQVRNLLDMAAEMGLVAVDGKGGRVVRLEPRFVEMAHAWVATDLAWMHFLASVTFARAIGGSSRR